MLIISTPTAVCVCNKCKCPPPLNPKPSCRPPPLPPSLPSILLSSTGTTLTTHSPHGSYEGSPALALGPPELGDPLDTQSHAVAPAWAPAAHGGRPRPDGVLEVRLGEMACPRLLEVLAEVKSQCGGSLPVSLHRHIMHLPTLRGELGFRLQGLGAGFRLEGFWALGLACVRACTGSSCACPL